MDPALLKPAGRANEAGKDDLFGTVFALIGVCQFHTVAEDHCLAFGGEQQIQIVKGRFVCGIRDAEELAVGTVVADPGRHGQQTLALGFGIVDLDQLHNLLAVFVAEGKDLAVPILEAAILQANIGQKRRLARDEVLEYILFHAGLSPIFLFGSFAQSGVAPDVIGAHVTDLDFRKGLSGRSPETAYLARFFVRCDPLAD